MTSSAWQSDTHLQPFFKLGADMSGRCAESQTIKRTNWIYLPISKKWFEEAWRPYELKKWFIISIYPMTFILILSQEKTAQTKQLLVLVCELYILI